MGGQTGDRTDIGGGLCSGLSQVSWDMKVQWTEANRNTLIWSEVIDRGHVSRNHKVGNSNTLPTCVKAWNRQQVDCTTGLALMWMGLICYQINCSSGVAKNPPDFRHPEEQLETCQQLCSNRNTGQSYVSWSKNEKETQRMWRCVRVILVIV